MNIRDKIIKIRKERNLTQENLAEELNVSRQTVSNWENKNVYPDIETLIIISNKFDISLDQLLKEDINMVKDIDKKVKSNKIKKIIIIILILLLLSLSFVEFSYFYFKAKGPTESSIESKCILNGEKIKLDVYVDLSALGKEKVVDYNKMPPSYIRTNGTVMFNNLDLTEYKSAYELLGHIIEKIEASGGKCGLNEEYKEYIQINL